MNSFGVFLDGHLDVQIPQPVQSSALTERECFVIWTEKFPTKPDTSVTSEYVKIRIFGFWLTSVILGVRMQDEQSSVGNVLSS